MFYQTAIKAKKKQRRINQKKSATTFFQVVRNHIKSPNNYYSSPERSTSKS